MRFPARHAFRSKACAALAAPLLFAWPVSAQIRIQGQVVLGGGGPVIPGLEIVSEDEDGAAADGGDSEIADVLQFTDGTSLHGTLESLDAGRRELGWRRDDVAEPLALNIGDVSRLTFKTRVLLSTAKGALQPPVEPPVLHSTVKLSGGNWLAANITGMQGGKLQMKLGDGSPLSVDRAHVEWIYFSKTAAPECYDGPTSLSGWTSTGGWTFRDGALRAASPTAIGRMFDILPDRTQYVLEVNQDPRAGNAFAITVHGKNPVARFQGADAVQIMFLGNSLQMSAQLNGSMHVEQADLQSVLDRPGQLGDALGSVPGADDKAAAKPVQIKILEDRPAGRIVVLINGHKIADWKLDKIHEGENKGALSIQPLGWNADAEQSISRIQVLPWNGHIPGEKNAEAETPAADLVSLAGGETDAGRIDSISADRLRIKTASGMADLPRQKIVMLRFKRPDVPPDEDPPVATANLAQRGEFEVTAASFHDGKFALQTAFAGELALPAAAVREIQLSHRSAAGAAPGDELVFRNGDRLRGKLEGAAEGGKLRWRLGKSGAVTEFAASRLSGVLLAGSDAKNPEAAPAAIVRFRNGDTLSGNNLKLDKDRLALTTLLAGELSIPRREVETVYFSPGGKPVIFDGASDPAGVIGSPMNPESSYMRARSGRLPPDKAALPDPWQHFNGAFSLPRSSIRGAALNVAPAFESMPRMLEFSFDAASAKGPLVFSAQIFSAEDNSGYLFQLHGSGIALYDMAPRRRAGAVPQQQTPFAGKVKEDAPERHIRLFADRVSGKVTTMVDGVVLGTFAPKTPAGPRDLGRQIILMTQPASPCAFSNIWLVPWNGQPPNPDPAPEKGHESAADVVSLANGDETRGAIQTVDGDLVKIDSDVGNMELPSPRVMTIRLGEPSANRKPSGARLRFASANVLTVSSYHMENGEIVCKSELAGELKMPMSALRELVLPVPASPEKPPAAAARGSSK